VMIVPPATLRRVVRSLAAHGGVRRGFLGVATFPVRLPPALGGPHPPTPPSPLRGEGGVEAGESGALLVSAVEPESPAARAGLLLGDAIVAVGGVRVTEPADLLPLLEEDRIGEPLVLRLVRAGESRELTVTVGVRGEPARRRP